MARTKRSGWVRRIAGAALSGGVLLQLGSCDIGTLTLPTTLDSRDALIQIVRGLVLTPVDQFLTDRINDLFMRDEEE